MRDDKLLKKLHSDPERGMSALISQYAGLVYAVVRGKLPADGFCQADIDGCVADTFSEFYCGLNRFDPAAGSIKSWLCVIAKNNALDVLRRRYRDSNILPLDDVTDTQCADDFSLEGNFEEQEQRTRLLDAIKALGQPDHEILVRKYYLSQSSREIASSLHMSVSAVDTRAHRAIQKLRKQFGGE